MDDLLVFPSDVVPRGHAVVFGRRAYVHPDDYERGKNDPEHMGSLTALVQRETPISLVRNPDMLVE
jgi:hypothetical protein